MNASKILVVDDESDIRRLLQEILTEEGYEVEVAADASQARAARARQAPDLVLLDIWMPDTDGITLLREWSSEPADGCPVVMMSGHGTVETAVEATRLGAYDFVEKPLSLAKLLRTVRARAGGARRAGRAANSSAAGAVGRRGARGPQPHDRAAAQRADASGRLQRAVAAAGRVRHRARGSWRASCISPARRLPARSYARLPHAARGQRAAATLLGRGRRRAPGLLEQARRGTLFLGDIEDLPASTAASAQRRARERPLRARGGGEPVPLEHAHRRLGAPGHRQRVLAEEFRRDLYAQLSVLLVRVPALRDYAEDVPELLRHYVDVLTETEGLRFRRFSVAAQNRLRNYPWPDNVRELRNLTRRFLLNAGREEIALEEVERELSAQTPADEPLVKHDLLALPLREAREQFERAYLQQQLMLCNGKVGLLAKRVDMERTHLYRKLRSLGIEIGHGAEE